MEEKSAQQIADENVTYWLEGNIDEKTKETIRDLQKNNPKELFECFYKSLDFGTAGLRGIMGVGTNRMNNYTVGMASQGLANCLNRDFANLSEKKIAIAYDCRHNGVEFAKVTAKILIANGIQVYIFDELRPTPELSFAVRELGCQAGIVITASHNPSEYNGYKVYWDDGGQIIAPYDKNLMDEVQKITSMDMVKWDGDENQIKYIGRDFDKIYLEKLKSLSVRPDVIAQNADMKIVYTPIHGTGYRLVPESLAMYGFKNVIHIPEQDVVDGDFPTVVSPNPEEAVAMKMALEKGKEVDADLIMATDPDADRVGISVKNHKGEFVLLNGNQAASLLCYYMIRNWAEKGKVKGKEFIVKTIVTTELLVDIAQKFGVGYYDVLTGFKYIGGVIKAQEGKQQFIVGGEESYGYLAGDFVRDKDAVVSASLLAETAAWGKSQGKSMFDLLLDIYMEFGYYKEAMTYIVKKGKEGLDEIKAIMKSYREEPPKEINNSKVICIKDYQKLEQLDVEAGKTSKLDFPVSNVLQFFLEDGTKISVRPSGTEPKIKYYIAVKETLESKEDFDKITDVAENKINAVAKALGI